MTTHKEALKLAREVIQMLGAPSPLHFSKEEIIKWQECNSSIATALAQPEQEPLCTAAMFDDAFLVKSGLSPDTKLYTTPPQRTWVGLTDEEVKKIAYNTAERKVAKDIEAKLKEKNDC